MREASTEEEISTLNQDGEILNTFITAGFVNKLLNCENKNTACQMAMIHYALAARKMDLDDIRRGMEMIELPRFLQHNRELWFSECLFPRTADIVVSPEVLVEKVVLHSSVGVLDDVQKETLSWCKQYVRYLPGNTLTGGLVPIPPRRAMPPVICGIHVNHIPSHRHQCHTDKQWK